MLEDASLKAARPLDWGKAAVSAYERYDADAVVAEVNQGGEMVSAVVHQIEDNLPIIPVHARRGKYTRAEPVAALYERRQVHHAGMFPELEDEMCNFTVDGLPSGKSPDRLDALVWALTHLMLKGAKAPRIRSL